MLLEILIGLAIGAIFAITIGACIDIAKNIFAQRSDINRVDIVKVDNDLFERIMSRNPRLRAAVNGETTGVVLQYKNGRIESCSSLEKSFSSDFDDCNGYRFKSTAVEEPIKI